MPHNPNPTERAARAEALAERLASALRGTVAHTVAIRDAGRAALDAWEAHKADLATLALNQEPHP